MYLRTILELEEERIVPLRARITERLAQVGPTVSQTVARMERDGLLQVAGLLGHPDRCPHGNPIPGLGDLVAGRDHEQCPQGQRAAGPLRVPAGKMTRVAIG
jgi:Mn-dependent DtxR family transcriptional regulator